MKRKSPVSTAVSNKNPFKNCDKKLELPEGPMNRGKKSKQTVTVPDEALEEEEEFKDIPGKFDIFSKNHNKFSISKC